jgi:LmbE family N-acetylglucosaminyl deacetylase
MKRAACVVTAALALAFQAWAQRDQADAAATQLALDRLAVSGRALMIAAHPDDENTALLAWLASDRKVRTGYLSLTRGEGGQNLIGSEQGELLGVIRTQELLAARSIDGAEQFFTRAVDFGYSKSAAESISKWNREQVLGDIVWVIRKFRPDVIILRFSGTSRDGHGQHQASAILGKEAFFAAADPKRYPEQLNPKQLNPKQLNKVKPWKAHRIVWNTFAFTKEQQKEIEALPDKLQIDVGAYDPLLGRSYAEIAGTSRSRHQSQAMGTAARRGSQKEYLVHVAGDRASKDLFDGVNLAPASNVLSEAAHSFDWRHPERTIPLLLKARPGVTDPDKRRELDELLASCAGLWLSASTDRAVATAGETVRIRAEALNRSNVPVTLHNFALEGAPNGLAAKIESPLANNTLRDQTLDWVANPPPREPLIDQPQPDPVLMARFNLTLAGQRLELIRPVNYRYVDDMRGELTRPFSIVPSVSVRFDVPSTIFPAVEARTIGLTLHSFAKTSGSARIELAAGWKAEPASVPFAFSRAGEESTVRFQVLPPAKSSTVDARALIEGSGSTSAADIKIIDYPHIPVQVVSTAATSTIVRADVVTLAQRIGYIMGTGDLIPDALRQLGAEVILLSGGDLASGDLSRFDAIVTGVRAYNVRDDLRANQHRLSDYMRGGGALIVQYNVLGRGRDVVDSSPPYPLKIGSDRVSVEDAPVTLLRQDHPLLKSPNMIEPADFAGWIQERGLYFASSWDARYDALLASADPGEKPHAGGLLYARVGKGVYIFTALSFFRQLPAGVPGAFRIFANLLSAGKVAAGSQ